MQIVHVDNIPQGISSFVGQQQKNQHEKQPTRVIDVDFKVLRRM